MLVVCSTRNATLGQSVWCYDDYGVLKWTYDTGGDVYAAICDGDNNVYIVGVRADNGDGHGHRNVWKLDRNGNYLAGADIGSEYATNSIDINNTNLYIGTMAGAYRTDHNFGNVSAEFFSSVSGVTAIRVDPEGNIYVGSGGANYQLAKYNSSLVLQWAVRDLEPSVMQVKAIDFLSNGDLICGYYGTGYPNPDRIRYFKADGTSTAAGEWGYETTGYVSSLVINGDDEICAVAFGPTDSFVVLNSSGVRQGGLNLANGLYGLFLDSADIPYVCGRITSSYNVWKVNLPAYTLTGIANTGKDYAVRITGDGIVGAVAAPTLSNVWLSKVGDYDNFQEGVDDDNSFSAAIATQNKIRWVDALEALLIGTSGDEWRIASSKLDTPLTPTNYTIRQQTEHGSSHIQPVRANSSLLFVDSVARKLREMTYSASEEKFKSPDLVSLAEHITKSGIITIARQKNPDSIIWATLGDGSLISMTYERDQNVVAWSKHPIGGFVQSVCVIPEATEDGIYLSVRRTISGTPIVNNGELVLNGTEQVTINGGDHTYIEKMAPRVFDTIEDAFFVDCGITSEVSPATSTITGLSHLEGETVKILADGVVADDAVVSEGEVTIKIGGVTTTALKRQVGLAYTSVVQPLRIVVGDSMGSITKVPELTVSLLDTGAAQYGNVITEMHDIDLNRVGVTNSSEITGLFSGEVSLTMPGQFDVLNPIFITSDAPLPLTVRCLIPKLEKTGR